MLVLTRLARLLRHDSPRETGTTEVAPARTVPNRNGLIACARATPQPDPERSSTWSERLSTSLPGGQQTSTARPCNLCNSTQQSTHLNVTCISPATYYSPARNEDAAFSCSPEDLAAARHMWVKLQEKMTGKTEMHAWSFPRSPSSSSSSSASSCTSSSSLW